MAARSRPTADRANKSLLFMSILSLLEISLFRVLPEMSVKGFFSEFRTFVLHDLRVGFDATIQRHGDLPGSFEHVRVFDGCFVYERIRASRRIALHYV